MADAHDDRNVSARDGSTIRPQLEPMRNRRTSHSKFLSLVLRHRPETIGLVLDAEGWADLACLLTLSKARGIGLTKEAVMEIVAASDKQRFALSPDKLRIRAQHGHSVAVDLCLEPMTPPDFLFHGTATRFLSPIRQQGLVRVTRRYVHLSASPAAAESVGRRHREPVVLRVRARELHAAGQSFFPSSNGVWLTDDVPPNFLAFPEHR